jgi:hypothetical protein
MSYGPQELDLLDQVFHRLVNMGEPVDPPAG